jgi:hypothetical protein
MKIRNGFVSNSSSSSFVILGFDGNDVNVSDDELKRRNILWKDRGDESTKLIGTLVIQGDEYWSEFDSSDFEKNYEESKKLMNSAIKDLKLGDRKLKLYFLERNYYNFGLAQDLDDRR